MSRRILSTTTKLLLAGLLITSMSSCGVIVDQSEVGVKKELGKVDKNPVEPGTHLYIPIIQQIDTMSTRVKAIDYSKNYRKKQPTYDEDKQMVYDRAIRVQTKGKLETQIDAVLYYRLNPKYAPEVYVNYGEDGVYDIKLVDGITRGVVRDVIGTVDLGTLINNREKYSKEITMELKKELEPKGIIVDKFVIRDIPIPKIIVEAVKLKNQKKEEVKRKELEVQIAKLEKQKQIILAQAKAESQLTVARAKAQATRIQAEADKYYIEQLRKASGDNDNYIRYMFIRKWNGEMPHVVAGKDGVGVIIGK